MSNEKFKVGDIVSFGGEVGRVLHEVDFEFEEFTIYVKFNSGGVYFTADGRFSESHTEPLLKLIERPKKKKKVWVNLYRSLNDRREVRGRIKSSRDQADRDTVQGRLACVEIEIDEE